jgi:hypothetical protein
MLLWEMSNGNRKVDGGGSKGNTDEQVVDNARRRINSCLEVGARVGARERKEGKRSRCEIE